MALITLKSRSGGFWNCQKISEYPPWETSPIWTHHRQVAGEEAGADGCDVHEGQHDPGGQQAGRAEEEHRVDAHDLERVDLVGDPHRAELGHDAGADLRGHHVAEGVGHELAQVAPGGEHARVGGRADRAVEVRALDPALQADDEDQAPDDDRRGDDQDARPGAAPRRRSAGPAGCRRRRGRGRRTSRSRRTTRASPAGR